MGVLRCSTSAPWQKSGWRDQSAWRNRAFYTERRDFFRSPTRAVRRCHFGDRLSPRLADVAAGIDGVLSDQGKPLVTGKATNQPGLFFCGLVASPTGQLRRSGLRPSELPSLQGRIWILKANPARAQRPRLAARWGSTGAAHRTCCALIIGPNIPADGCSYHENPDRYAAAICIRPGLTVYWPDILSAKAAACPYFYESVMDFRCYPGVIGLAERLLLFLLGCLLRLLCLLCFLAMLPSVIPKSLLNASRRFDMHAIRVHHNFKIDTSRFEQGKRASQTRTFTTATSLAMCTDVSSRLRPHVQQ